MSRVHFVVFALVLALAACGPSESEPPQSARVPTVAKAKKRCPDPNNRDSRDPCSVAYIKRTPSRFSEDALR